MKRVKVNFHSRFETVASKRCWVSIPESFKFISDLQHELCMRFLENNDNDQSSLYLTLEQYQLLPNEVKKLLSSLILISLLRVLISYNQVM
jgi:hypothetical protein